MKQPFKERLGDFMSGKGFYIVLLLCVAAIGISGYYLYTTFQAGTPVSAPVSITVTPPAVSQSAVPVKPTVPAVAVTPAATPKAVQSASPSAVPTPAPTTEQAADFFTWPVKGSVLTGYSGGALVYSETMADWRTHDGLDLSATAGTGVLAAADGTVTAVTTDDLLGVTVTIDHGAGLTSLYAGLADSVSVAPGDSVKAGAVIASVGDTAVGESALGTHLHFAMAVDGVPVDPLDYLPQLP